MNFSRFIIVLNATLIVCVAAVCGLGETLKDYQRRIVQGKAAARELVEMIGSEDPAVEAEKIAELRRLIPKTEKVDAPGGSIETDNAWLSSSLDELSAEPDNENRILIITAAGDRLAAISKSLIELDLAAASRQSKDEDKRKLAEILSRPEYQKSEAKGESLFQRWWREFIEWLARVFPRPMSEPAVPSGFDSLKLGLQVVVYAVVIGLIGFLVWRFAPVVFGRFRKRKKSEREDRIVLGERIAHDASAADIFDEAENHAREGDYRGAIRKGYIALLCELGDRRIVRLARYKTNRDYLRDVRKRTGLFENMTGLTGNFESSWYGIRLAEAKDWADFRERCQRAITLARDNG